VRIGIKARKDKKFRKILKTIEMKSTLSIEAQDKGQVFILDRIF